MLVQLGWAGKAVAAPVGYQVTQARLDRLSSANNTLHKICVCFKIRDAGKGIPPRNAFYR